MKTKTKILTAVASVLVLVLCATGVAFAADGAVPGDTLYGFDRAVEKIGIGSGGLQERLAEATELANKGQNDEALAHAAAAVAAVGGVDQGASQANAALNMAANAVEAANQGESEQIRARVAEMLRWMASTQANGADFGNGVANRAREIAGEANGGAVQEQSRTATTEQKQQEQGECDGEQNATREQKQDGECTQTQDGELEQNRNGDCDETQNKECEQNQSGDCTQSQTNQSDGAGKR